MYTIMKWFVVDENSFLPHEKCFFALFLSTKLHCKVYSQSDKYVCISHYYGSKNCVDNFCWNLYLFSILRWHLKSLECGWNYVRTCLGQSNFFRKKTSAPLGALKWNFPPFWEIITDQPTDRRDGWTDRVIGNSIPHIKPVN